MSLMTKNQRPGGPALRHRATQRRLLVAYFWSGMTPNGHGGWDPSRPEAHVRGTASLRSSSALVAGPAPPKWQSNGNDVWPEPEAKVSPTFARACKMWCERAVVDA